MSNPVLGLSTRPRGVLAIGAHPDDVEIGCGGTLLELSRRYPGLPVTVAILTGSPDRKAEAKVATELFLEGCDVTLTTFDLPDGHLPAHWDATKAALRQVFELREVDVVLAPQLGDAHQDHRLIAEMVPTIWRDHLVLGYEIPKWDGDLGRPTTYVQLDETTARDKVRLLSKAYGSQVGRDWWDDETFLGLARVRGMECRARYAEAFYVTKAVFSW